jgi:hypothetical protein
MPNADVSVQFTGNPYSFYAYGDSTISYNTYNVIAANQIMFMPFTVSSNMVNPVNAIIMDWFFGYTGTTNVAIYDSTGTGGSPGNLIASSTPATNPTPRPWTFTFASPPTLTAGVRYYLAQSVNASCQWAASSALSGVTGYTLSYTYSGSFPSSAAGAASFSAISPYFLYTAHAQHWMYVSEAQQDGLTTYVFDNTVGHADFYGIGPISITPTSTICVTTRGFMQKSDAGFRQGAVQMKSGSTTVVSPTLNLSTGFGYAYRTDLTDPATGSAWTATAVNAIQIGPTVIS